MDRYKQSFEGLKNKGQGAFMPFVILGDPDYETSLQIIKALVDSGADMLELGIPFSDPIADGPAIQAASGRALESGMKTHDCVRMLRQIRDYNARIPIGLLIYSNLVYSYGTQDFYRDAKAAGVDSILIADVPMEEIKPFLHAAEEYGISQIFLATPATPPDRLKKIVGLSSTFIYIVAVLGVTGARQSVSDKTTQTVQKIRSLTSLPLMTGFGISKPEHVKPIMNAGSDGVVIGSAIAGLIEKNVNNAAVMLEGISQFSREVKMGLVDSRG